jgi:monoamine oxidase
MSRSLFAVLARRYGPPVDPAARRRFLGASLAAGASLMLPACATRPRRQTDAGRVVVIGAGFAGLACAHELHAAGVDVTVLEARSRVGGRVLSFGEYIPGRTIEGGGELIGSNHPAWVAYAERFGLTFLDVTEDEDADFPIMLGGRRITGEESLALYEELDAVLAGMNGDGAGVNPDAPWAHADAQRLDAMSVADWIERADASPLCKRAMRAMLAGDNAQACERQSYLGMLASIAGGGGEAYWTESEVYRCEGGNQRLAHCLASALGGRVRLGCAVRRVESRGAGAAVTCADGRVIDCDEVVLAVPPTVWEKVEFDPALPAELSPQMGPAVKHLAHVRTRFWEGLNADPASLSDGDITWTWDGTDGQAGDADACLTSFSGGPAAEGVRARGAEEREGAYRGALESLYPGFAREVVDTRFMDWPGDPWARAGYSFPAPGQVTAVGPRLQRPVGRVHLAGEHTCYKFVGYMEGALQSGLAVARRIGASAGVASAGVASAGVASGDGVSGAG